MYYRLLCGMAILMIVAGNGIMYGARKVLGKCCLDVLPRNLESHIYRKHKRCSRCKKHFAVKTKRELLFHYEENHCERYESAIVWTYGEESRRSPTLNKLIRKKKAEVAIKYAIAQMLLKLGKNKHTYLSKYATRVGEPPLYESGTMQTAQEKTNNRRIELISFLVFRNETDLKSFGIEDANSSVFLGGAPEDIALQVE